MLIIQQLTECSISTPTLYSQDLVRLKSIQVNEGGRVSISSDNLKVVAMDYSKFGVTDNDIIFHVTVQPSHGVVDLSDWERHEVKRFSLADIKSDKVLTIYQVLYGFDDLPSYITTTLVYIIFKL